MEKQEIKLLAETLEKKYNNICLGFSLYFWRTSRTTSRWRSTQKVQATQNFIKDEMTGRVDIYWRIFEAYFIWLLSSKISHLETLKLLEVLVSVSNGNSQFHTLTCTHNAWFVCKMFKIARSPFYAYPRVPSLFLVRLNTNIIFENVSFTD